MNDLIVLTKNNFAQVMVTNNVIFWEFNFQNFPQIFPYMPGTYEENYNLYIFHMFQYLTLFIIFPQEDISKILHS